MKLKMNLDESVKKLEFMTQEISDKLFLLSQKPPEQIELRFYKQAILPIKEALAFAQNIHFEIYKRTEVSTYLDLPKQYTEKEV